MRRYVPPINQRLLNTRVKKVFGRKYKDWYEYALELEKAGMKRDEITVELNALLIPLGIKLSKSTIANWMIRRAKCEERKTAA